LDILLLWDDDGIGIDLWLLPETRGLEMGEVNKSLEDECRNESLLATEATEMAEERA
jgi:hypothetical protein